MVFSHLLADAAFRLLRAYLARIGPSLSIRIYDLSSRSYVTAEAAVELTRRYTRERPTICLVWIADHVNLVSLGYASPALRSLARNFHFFADDSLGGLIMRAIVRDLGAHSIYLSYSNPAERLRALNRFLEQKPPAFLAVDGHGPYYKVGEAFVNLAKTVNATVVPCAVVARPSAGLRTPRVRISVPLPRSRVSLVLGEPEHFGNGPSESSCSGAKRLEAVMTDVRRRATALEFEEH